jgi:hypothetical protein
VLLFTCHSSCGWCAGVLDGRGVDAGVLVSGDFKSPGPGCSRSACVSFPALPVRPGLLSSSSRKAPADPRAPEVATSRCPAGRRIQSYGSGTVGGRAPRIAAGLASGGGSRGFVGGRQ